jgi:hypothetical protein
MESWYRFLAPDSKPLYGYGTLAQALRYAGLLDHAARASNVIHATRTLTDEEARDLGLEDNADAFSLTSALTEAVQRYACAGAPE